MGFIEGWERDLRNNIREADEEQFRRRQQALELARQEEAQRQRDVQLAEAARLREQDERRREKAATPAKLSAFIEDCHRIANLFDVLADNAYLDYFEYAKRKISFLPLLALYFRAFPQPQFLSAAELEAKRAATLIIDQDFKRSGLAGLFKAQAILLGVERPFFGDPIRNFSEPKQPGIGFKFLDPYYAREEEKTNIFTKLAHGLREHDYSVEVWRRATYVRVAAQTTIITGRTLQEQVNTGDLRAFDAKFEPALRFPLDFCAEVKTRTWTPPSPRVEYYESHNEGHS